MSIRNPVHLGIGKVSDRVEKDLLSKYLGSVSRLNPGSKEKKRKGKGKERDIVGMLFCI